MTTSVHRDRGQLLYEQGRYEQAVREFQSALAHDPDDTYAKYLQAYSLYKIHRTAEALSLSDKLIADDPEDPYYYELKAWCLLDLNQTGESLKAVQEAIELNPNITEFWYSQGAIQLSLHHPSAALNSAETGLSICPDDTECLTLRAQCLMQLGRTNEVPTALLATLRQQPNDASVHALAGMAMLETGNHQQARQYFADALRLDPTLTVAEAGMADAIKSKNVVYRLFLRYLFWLDRQSDLVRRTAVLGGVFVAYFIVAIGYNLHILFLSGLGLALFTIVVLSWFIEPTFNVVLAFDKTGQYLIQPRSRRLYRIVPVFLLIGAGLIGFEIATWPGYKGGWCGIGMLFVLLASMAYDWAVATTPRVAQWRGIWMYVIGVVTIATIGLQLATGLGLLGALLGVVLFAFRSLGAIFGDLSQLVDHYRR